MEPPQSLSSPSCMTMSATPCSSAETRLFYFPDVNKTTKVFWYGRPAFLNLGKAKALLVFLSFKAIRYSGDV